MDIPINADVQCADGPGGRSTIALSMTAPRPDRLLIISRCPSLRGMNALASAGEVALLIALTLGIEYSWASTPGVALFGLFVAMCGVFLR